MKSNIRNYLLVIIIFIIILVGITTFLIQFNKFKINDTKTDKISYIYKNKFCKDLQVRILVLKGNTGLKGEDFLFYSAIKGDLSCDQAFPTDDIAKNLCLIIKNKDKNAYNFLENFRYKTDNDKKRIIGISSFFIGDKKYKCDDTCKSSVSYFNSYLSGIKVKEFKKEDLFLLDDLSISNLIISGKINFKDLDDFYKIKCK
ncbi:MAG: hypothetical protein PHE25_01620 [Candidatus Gracilibacteria bacterium]|nr:hypothetical protein [Candidatus Gracilibacteria bacterium]